MKSDIRIDTIKPAQAVKLRRLFKRAVAEDFNYFPETYRRRVLADNNLPRLAWGAVRPSRILLGAQQTNSLVGYAITGVNSDRTAKLYWLYVSPEARSQRLGSQLLDRLLVILPERGIQRMSLVTHNYQDYYSKYGFRLEGHDQLYGVDMKVMSYTW